MASLSSSDTIPINKTDQEELLKQYAIHCKFRTSPMPGAEPVNNSVPYCPSFWDGFACWEEAAPNTTVWRPCPNYVHNFNPEGNVSRVCMEDGKWFVNSSTGKPWANYSQCKTSATGNITTDLNERLMIYLDVLPYIKTLSITGYAVSLVSLVAAIAILLSIKRLYCPRNTLHINLFMSYILRALLVLITRGSFIENDSNAATRYGHMTMDDYLKQNGIGCRVLSIIFEYTIMANYFWIFIEGFYLNSVISLSVFRDHSKIWYHIIAGWIPPVIFLTIWAAIRLAGYDNKNCWTMSDDEYPNTFWVLRGPIASTIVMNLLITINISRIIFVQFRNQTSLREQQSTKVKYRKLARSTLVLLAVCGVHFVVLLIVSFMADRSANIYLEVTWLIIDQFVSSFQGLLASFLFCFSNTDVRSEIDRILVRHRTALGLQRESSRISSRVHRNSEIKTDPVESVKLTRKVSLSRQLVRQLSNTYTSMPNAAPKATLSVPHTHPNLVSCESLYLRTCDNSDDDGDLEQK